MGHVFVRARGDRAWLVVGIGVLATLVVVIGGLYAYDTRVGGPLDPQTVQVTSVDWSLGGIPLTSGAGVAFHAGSHLTVQLAFTCGICGTLTLTNASTNSTGFAVTSSNLPLLVPAGDTGNISVTVSTPRVDYSGPLNIELN